MYIFIYSIFCFYKLFVIEFSVLVCIYAYVNGYCKDQIWYESKTGMDPGPLSPNNEFIECRSES